MLVKIAEVVIGLIAFWLIMIAAGITASIATIRERRELDRADDAPEGRRSSVVDITEDMIDRASRVLWEEASLPYIADIRHFTDEDVRNGELRRADNDCEEKNRSLVRRALEAALNQEP